MATFYPSCVVNFKLKFDETLHLQPEVTPRSVEEMVADPPAGAGSVQPQPLILRRGAENVSFVLGRLPKSGSVSLPGYRQAGQFDFVFDFRDLPIDPRTVRSAAVEIHQGAVSSDAFARGMRGVNPNGTRDSVLVTRDAAGQPNEETLILVGIVDEWSVRHESSSSEISLRGRDMRGILLDTPLTNDPKIATQILASLDITKPINQLVEELLSYNPLFGDFSVVVNPAEWPNGVVPVIGDPSILPRNRRGARGNNTGRVTSPGGSARMSFWDAIVKFCFLVGAIPYFQGTQLLIRPSRSIFDQAQAGNALNPAPFAGGRPRTRDAQTNQPIDPPLRFRRLVYGRDILSVSFDRKMGGMARPKVVRAVGVDTSSADRGQGRVIQGFWPPRTAPPATRRSRVAPGASAAQEDGINVPVAGVRDPERLVEIARAIYEEIGRGELGGNCTTRNLASFGGTNADADLLRLKPGDGIEFLTDVRQLTPQSPLVSALTDHNRAGFEELVAQIKARIGDENLARVIAATSRGQIQEMQRFFRVSSVTYTWSETGVQIGFDFQNYVVSRSDVRREGDPDFPQLAAGRPITVPTIQVQGVAGAERIRRRGT